MKQKIIMSNYFFMWTDLISKEALKLDINFIILFYFNQFVINIEYLTKVKLSNSMTCPIMWLTKGRIPWSGEEIRVKKRERDMNTASGPMWFSLIARHIFKKVKWILGCIQERVVQWERRIKIWIFHFTVIKIDPIWSDALTVNVVCAHILKKVTCQWRNHVCRSRTRKFRPWTNQTG